MTSTTTPSKSKTDDKNYFVNITPDCDNNGVFTGKYTSKMGQLEENQTTSTMLSHLIKFGNPCCLMK